MIISKRSDDLVEPVKIPFGIVGKSSIFKMIKKGVMNNQNACPLFNLKYEKYLILLFH